MKKLLLILISCASLSYTHAQGLYYPVPKQHNLTSISASQKQAVTKELEERTPLALQSHPEYGVNPYNAPCTDCVELLEKRTESSRYFITNGKNGAEFHMQQSYAPMHFKDEQGRWRTIDPRLKPTNTPHLYTAPNQFAPVAVDAGLGFTSIKRYGAEFKFNRELELLYNDDVTTTSLGKANWTNYTVGDDGIRVIDAWPGIDIVVKINKGAVESDFVVKHALANTTGRYLVRDYMQLPANYRFEGLTPGQSTLEGFSVVNYSGDEAFTIGKPFAFDANEEAGSYGLWYNYAQAGNYVDIEIPAHWLNSADRAYPVTIDPPVTATYPFATITGSGYDPVCFQNGCTYNMPTMSAPANSTVTDISFSFEYTPTGGCAKTDGAIEIKYGACRYPSSGGGIGCSGGAGACFWPAGTSIFTDLQACVPAPQCAGYNMNFSLNFFRCNAIGGAACSNGCIYASKDWIMTVTGQTVSVASISGAQVMCVGGSKTITVTPQYGVPPYSVVWNPGALPGATVTVSPASTQLYTATVTDACGQVAVGNNTVNVTVNSAVNPGFSFSTATVCAGATFNVFGGGSGTPVNSYDYVVPSSNQAGGVANNMPNIMGISYPTAGVYPVTLNYTNSVNNCVASLTQNVTVNAVVTPTITITANPSGTVCAGQAVTFTATITNGGTGTVTWRKNGSLISSSTISGGTVPPLVYSLYVNGDVMSADLTSNAPCANPVNVSSNTIVMSVTPIIAPTVTITQSPANPICPGTSVTYTANITGGGPTPSFQWQVGVTQQAPTTSNTFTTTSLVNNDQVAVTLTSSLPASCVSPATSFSNVLTAVVAGVVVPSVSITANPAVGICPGANVTFTAVPVNGGGAPTYQWYNNGVPIAGATSSTYSTTGLVAGNAITVRMNSNATCPTLATVTSNSITVPINAVPVPSVSIASNPSFPVCAGSSVTFTATPTNGGALPTYQWYNGATPIGGATSSTYTSAALTNGASITCVMTSNAACASPTTATSNAIVANLTAAVTPSVVITSNPTPATICAGASITFTATPTNGGAAPTYQWYKGAAPIGGATASTYTTTGLANNDAIKVVMTSNDPCASPTTATSNVITVTVNPVVVPSVTIAANPAGAICAGASVTFTATPTNGGAAPVYQWYNGATPIAGATSATYTSAALTNGAAITVQLTSNATCVSPTTATSAAINMVVNPVLVPSVSVSANPPTAVCAGSNITFTATPTNGGAAPTYQWYNGAAPIAGATSATYSSTALTNGASITVQMTSNATCANPLTATSTAVVVNITAQVLPSVVVAANPAGAICAGQSVTFTATPTNGGAGPTYQWYNGANPIGGATSATYTTSGLANGDAIKVVLTSNDPCANPLTATSNIVNMTVNPIVAPSVTIAANPAGAICAGQSVTFTATPTNGGAAPTYQWYNGATPIAGATGATYTSTTLANADAITVKLTSNAACVNPTTATSTAINMVVNAIPVPSVSIAANPAGPICSGTNVTFTATPTNGGAAPTYEWFIGAVSQGAPSATNTFSSSALTNGASVTCKITSNATCVSPTTATSNAVVITVNTTLVPSVSITASPSNTICAGQVATFTATPTNGGPAPTYQWYNGATPIGGATSATYTTNAIANGDQIKVVLTSNDPCANPLTGTSNIINMTVNPNVVPSVTIAANPGSTVCAGTNVTYTATPVNGGAAPTYQWYVGANPVPAGLGGTLQSVTTNQAVNGVSITCQITSNAACASPTTATSAPLVMTINPVVVPAVSIAVTPAGPVCAGAALTFTATPTAGAGANPTYQWYNGVSAIGGATASTYISSALANGDVIHVVMTSNDPCPSPATGTSNNITVQTISQLIPSVGIAASPSGPICAGTNVTFTASPTNGGNTPTYLWFINGAPSGAGSTLSSALLNTGDVISVTMTSSEPCANPTAASSNTVTMTVNPVQTPSVTITSNPASPICAGTSVTFTATPVNGGATPTYQWYNGANPIAGATNATYTTTGLTTGDNITVQMTSSIACPSPATVTSNALSYTVNTVPVPSVSITANPNTPICPGTNITFTATPTNGGAAPTYQWYNGALPIAGETAATYSSTTISNGDVITVEMTSNALCASPALVTSNSLPITVLFVTAPVVSVVANPVGAICAGQNVTFTATPGNGGPAPSYQWQINGINAGTNSPTFSTTTLTNNDAVTVTMTSNQPCANPTTATSTPINMAVNPIVVPTVTIADNPTGNVCQGTPVTFTATPTNEGPTPTYVWKVNGTVVGGNSPTYTENNPVNGATVTVTLTSSDVCPSPQTVTSAGIILSVTSTVVPAVAITPSVPMPVCDNTSVDFTAQTTGGGAAPTYQWYVNGTAQAGATNALFTYTPAVGDAITVDLTSNAQCASPTTATAAINPQVLPYLSPTVTIVSNPTTSVCLGQLVSFTATTTNGGPNGGTFQWELNGISVGINSSTYASNGINPGDVVDVVYTSNYQCLNAPSVTSNPISLTFNPPIAVTVTPASATTCTYESTLITATATGGDGGPYVYTWDDGTVSDNITVSPDVNTSYTVTVTDQCGGTPGTATSSITVSPTPIANFSVSPMEGVTTLDDVFFNNTSQNADWWSWNFGEGPNVDLKDTAVHHYDIPGTYDITLYATNASGCADTMVVKLEVKQQAIFYVPNAFTPNADGKNELFRVYTTHIYQPYTLVIYARSGQEVYNSETDSPAGSNAIYWTGQMHNSGKLLPEGTYVYYLYIHDPYLSKRKWSTRGYVTMFTGQPQ